MIIEVLQYCVAYKTKLPSSAAESTGMMFITLKSYGSLKIVEVVAIYSKQHFIFIIFFNNIDFA